MIRYLTPEWLEESAKMYRLSSHFEKALSSVSAKLCFRVTADPDWGIDGDMIFVVDVNKGNLVELAFYNENAAQKMAEFTLAASPQNWKEILRKDKKFITEFLMGRVSQESGSRVALLKITPYANHLVDALTQFELQFPDEMSEDELETYRTDLTDLRAKLNA